MKTIENLLSSETLSKVPEDFILGALETLSIDSIETKQRERFTWKFWKGESVNGSTHEEIMETGIPFPGGFCYLIRDSKVSEFIYFQTFDPKREGVVSMSEERAKDLAAELCEKLAAASTLSILIKHVEESFRSDE